MNFPAIDYWLSPSQANIQKQQASNVKHSSVSTKGNACSDWSADTYTTYDPFTQKGNWQIKWHWNIYIITHIYLFSHILDWHCVQCACMAQEPCSLQEGVVLIIGHTGPIFWGAVSEFHNSHYFPGVLNWHWDMYEYECDPESQIGGFTQVRPISLSPPEVPQVSGAAMQQQQCVMQR